MRVCSARSAWLAAGAILLAACAARPAATPSPAPAAQSSPPPASSATQPAPAATRPAAEPAPTRTARPAPATPRPSSTARPVDTATPAPAFRVDFAGVSFRVPAGLARTAEARALPGQGAPDDPDLPPMGLFPPRIEFSFPGYAHGGAFHEPRIMVYSVADYERLNPVAAEVITETRRALAQRPAVPAQSRLLPLLYAGQTIRARFAYLDFAGGAGFRFVTHYTQGLIPISSRELFYTFQGLTADGAYYVAALLPLGASALPDTYEAPAPPGGPAPPSFDHPDFVTLWPRYLAAVEQALEALPADEYYPSLEALDAWMQSLAVAEPVAVADCPADLRSTLAPEGSAYVSLNPPVSNRLRAAPGVAASLVDALPAGTAVDLLAGPVCADALLWWYVVVDGGPQAGLGGWTAEGSATEQWLVACPSEGLCPPAP